MVFSSLTFLLCFLPLVLACYYLARGIRVRNLILCVFSLVFYAWGEPVYILLMLASILVNYGIGLLLERAQRPLYRRGLLSLALILNLGAIGLFKYGNFLLETISALTGRPMPVLQLSLPLGISFYTFQILSYVIDVFRRKTTAQRSLLNLATYIVLFPQLVAGPIVRYEEIQRQLTDRKETPRGFTEGLTRFSIGLGKKVIIANAMASIGDPIFDGAGLPDGAVAWLGAIAYMLQIYYDFSGYSDMAIGLGRMFGFRFSENFRAPYRASSVTDFWRRWHISLSTWFRDYVYIPLGGSRKSIPRNILNLLIVWALTGLWHGASWSFVLWGLYYGFLLILEKYVLAGLLPRIPLALRHFGTLALTLFGWLIFRLPDVSLLLPWLRSMAAPALPALGAYLTAHADVLTHVWLILPAIIGCLPLRSAARRCLGTGKHYLYARTAWALAVYYGSLALLFSATYNPFIYFRF